MLWSRCVGTWAPQPRTFVWKLYSHSSSVSTLTPWFCKYLYMYFTIFVHICPEIKFSISWKEHLLDRQISVTLRYVLKCILDQFNIRKIIDWFVNPCTPVADTTSMYTLWLVFSLFDREWTNRNCQSSFITVHGQFLSDRLGLNCPHWAEFDILRNGAWARGLPDWKNLWGSGLFWDSLKTVRHWLMKYFLLK